MEQLTILSCDNCLSSLWTIMMNKEQELVYMCAGCGEQFDAKTMQSDLVQLVKETYN